MSDNEIGKVHKPEMLKLTNEIPKEYEFNSNPMKPAITAYNQYNYKSTCKEGINEHMKYGGDDSSSKAEFNDKGNKYFKFRGESIELVGNPLEELEFCNEVIIEQKIEFVEILSGCENPNKYHVYLVDRSGRKKYLFKCKEESNWCCRNCCPGNIRSFKMKMVHVINTNKRYGGKRTIAEFQKLFKCSCFCCFRPVLRGYYIDPQGNIGQPFGEIKESFGCNPSLKIINEEKIIKWKSRTKYCQCGYSCRCYSFGKCYEINFWIYNGDSVEKNANPVGNIHKVFKGLSEMVSNSNSFVLTFPQGATMSDKLLLIGTVLMIDYRYFESMGLFNCSHFL